MVLHKKFGTGTICKLIFGLAQNIWTSPKHFGACKMTWHNRTWLLFSTPTVPHLVNMDGVEPVTMILNMKRIWAKEDTVTSLNQGEELLIDLNLK